MITDDKLKQILRAAIKRSGNNISRWARENGFAAQRANIGEMASGKRGVSEAVADRLGYRLHWVKKKD